MRKDIDKLEDHLSFLKRSIKNWDSWLFMGSLIITLALIFWYVHLTTRITEDGSLSAWYQLIYDLIPEVLGALLIFSFSFIFLRIILNARAQQEILQITKSISDELSEKMPDIDGISKFKLGRDSLNNLTPMAELFQRSQTDISLLATQHGYVVKHQLKLLGQMAERGRKIRIIMMSPFDKTGAINPLVQLYEARYINYIGLQSELEINKQRLQDWHGALSPEAKRNVQLKVHFDLPIGNFTLIDCNLNSGVVQVEPYMFANLEVGDLVIYVAYAKSAKEFFDLHVRTFNWFWQRGQDMISLSGEGQA